MKSRSLLDKRNIYLAYQIARCQLLSQDRNVLLGNLWHVLYPLLLSIVLLTVFTYRFKVDIPNYGFYILLGIIHFNFFASTTMKATNALIRNRNILLSSTIRKEILVLASGIHEFIIFLIAIGVFFALMLVMRLPITLTVLYLPIIIIAQCVFNSGLALLLAALNVIFRDIGYLWGIFMRVLFFATPIFYKFDDFGGHALNDVLRLNPLSQILIMSRECLLYNSIPNTMHLLMLISLSMAFFIFGWGVFKYLEPRLVDHL